MYRQKILYKIFITSRFSGEFVQINRNAIFIENEQVEGVHLVADSVKCKDFWEGMLKDR